MIDPTRQEVLRLVEELSERFPEWRFGQMIACLSYAARGSTNEAIWDMEDDELVAAAKRQLEYRPAPQSHVA